jgi:hypothetical protein
MSSQLLLRLIAHAAPALNNPLQFPSNATLGFKLTSLSPITINGITI